MNKRERIQLTKKANKDFGKPYVIETDDEQGKTKYGIIQTESDEIVFINHAATNRFWYARDLDN